MIPSGEQVVLRHGEQRAVVVEVGGGLRTYAVGDWEVLDGYAEDERCTGGRGQPLVPWPNRVRDGRYAFGGAKQQLALTEPDKLNAIHGLGRWVAWTASDHAADRVTMRLDLRPQPGWPFALDLEVRYALGPEGLSVTTTATNLGDGPCPYGAGWHPYLSVGTERIDDARLRAPGRRRARTDARAIPAGEPVDVEGTRYDFRTSRAIGDVRLDTAYRDLERDPDGLARVELAGPDGRAVALWMDAAYRHLMLFTGDTLPEPARRRHGLAAEPMTCPPDALNSGEDLVVLAPGETTSATWGLTPRRGP